jgi:hypothetical protein
MAKLANVIMMKQPPFEPFFMRCFAYTADWMNAAGIGHSEIL